MNPGTGQIEALTSLRFFAALLVVLFHHGTAQFAGCPTWVQHIVQGGYVGVPFFFVLSGFILTYTYARSTAAGGLDARQFWLARIARIYPVYVVSLLLSAPLFWSGAGERPPEPSPLTAGLQAGAVVGLVQSWIPAWAFAWNGPAWSLSVEAFFYAAFPFLLMAGARRRIWLLGGLAAAGVLLLAVDRLRPGSHAVAGLQAWLGWAHPLLWLPLFLLGMAAADLRSARKEDGGDTGPGRVRTGWGTLALLLAIGGVMALNLQRWSQLLYCYAVAPLCGWAIYRIARENSWITRGLSHRILVVLGEASYSLYILHRPIHDWWAWLSGRWNLPSTETAGGFVFYLTACLLLSVLSRTWLEYPCREWIRSRARGRRRPGSPSTAARLPLATRS